MVVLRGDGRGVSTARLAERGVRGEERDESGARAPGVRLRRFKPTRGGRSWDIEDGGKVDERPLR